MQKEREKESNKERENNKLDLIFQFIDKLKSKNKLKLSEKEFNKELILFFNVTDFRVVASKTKLMVTLDLIKTESIRWGEREIWIKK